MTKLNFIVSAAAGIVFGLDQQYALARAYYALTNKYDLYSDTAVSLWITGITLSAIVAGSWLAKHLRISFKR